MMQEAMDLCSESARKKRRRDGLRATVSGALNAVVPMAVDSILLSVQQSQGFIDHIAHYLNSTRSFLEMETGSDAFLLEMRLNLCLLIVNLMNYVPDLSVYLSIFSHDLRYDLYSLISKWVPVWDSSVSLHIDHASADLALHAYRAVCALGRGSMFDYKSAVESGGYFCQMIVSGLRSPRADCALIAQDAIVLLLSSNDNPDLFEWTLQLCYADRNEMVRQGVFGAIVKLVSTPPHVGTALSIYHQL